MSKQCSKSRTTSKITEEKQNPCLEDDVFEKKTRNTIHNYYLELDSIVRSIFKGYCPRTNMKWPTCAGCHEEKPGHLNSVRNRVDHLLTQIIELHEVLG